MPDKRLIVITGASRGLGQAMVPGLAKLGHTIAGCARNKDAVANLAKQFPAPHRFDAVDVADDAAVGRWAKEVIGSHGAPDLILNNAAIMNETRPLWEVPLAEFQAMLAVNIQGIYSVCRHFLPAMLAAKKGTIVNFSSGWGRSTSPEVAPYCATKYAVEGLSAALAQELPAPLAAMALNPGIIHTDMLQSAWGEGAAAYPSAESWAIGAVPFVLQLGRKDNGRPVSVP